MTASMTDTRQVVATTTFTIVAHSVASFDKCLAGVKAEILRADTRQCSGNKGTAYGPYDYHGLMEVRDPSGGVIGFIIRWYRMEDYEKHRGQWESPSHMRRYSEWGILPNDIKVHQQIVGA